MTTATRWLVRILGGIVTLIVLAVTAIYVSSSSHLHRKRQIKPETVAIPTDSASIARGQHIAETRGCTGCHGPKLAGGQFINAPIIGVLYARNLTPGKGGAGEKYTDADWVRALRHGVRPDSTPLLFMPSQEFNQLNARDLGALIAWLKTLAPVDTSFPAPKVGPLGRVLYLAGQLPLVPADLINHDEPPTREVPEGETAAYGEYLALACRGCHGNTFSGGKIPGSPPDMKPARNLTPDSATGTGKWTLEDFRTAIRVGRLPDGVMLDTLSMPVPMTRHFTDVESAALWAYFRSLPAKPYGNR